MPEDFPRFGLLPLELRLRIWGFTFPRARIICTYGFGYGPYGDVPYYIPIALHVHSESRSETSRIYKKIELNVRASKAATSLKWKVVYFNPAVDVIQFAYSDPFIAAFETGRVSEWCRQYNLIKRLGIAACERIKQPQRQYDLTQFSELEELVPLESITECRRHGLQYLLDWEDVEELDLHHCYKSEEDDKFRADAPGEMQNMAAGWRAPRKLKVSDVKYILNMCECFIE